MMMKGIFQLAMASVLLGTILTIPALSQEQDKRGPHMQTERNDRGAEPRRETQGPPPPDGMQDRMMSMMSDHQEMMGRMLQTMRGMAQTLKEEAQDPDAEARADQLLAQIEQMESQHRRMMGRMEGMMPGRGGASPDMMR
jgi:hypothetical protein